MGEIAIAGQNTSSVVHLPRAAGGLMAFLKDDSLAIIWNFIVRNSLVYFLEATFIQ
jgi:hypothetical protein